MGIDKRSANMLFRDLSIEFSNLEDKYDYFLKNKVERSVKFGGFGSITILKEANSSLLEVSISDDKITTEYPIKILLSTFFLVFIGEHILVNGYIRRVFYIPVERNSLYTL